MPPERTDLGESDLEYIRPAARGWGGWHLGPLAPDEGSSKLDGSKGWGFLHPRSWWGASPRINEHNTFLPFLKSPLRRQRNEEHARSCLKETQLLKRLYVRGNPSTQAMVLCFFCPQTREERPSIGVGLVGLGCQPFLLRVNGQTPPNLQTNPNHRFGLCKVTVSRPPRRQCLFSLCRTAPGITFLCKHIIHIRIRIIIHIHTRISIYTCTRCTYTSRSIDPILANPCLLIGVSGDHFGRLFTPLISRR